MLFVFFQVFHKLRDLYKGNINDLDIYPAGILESTPQGPGPLFRAVILDQFERIRDADRFWFENKKNQWVDFLGGKYRNVVIKL